MTYYVISYDVRATNHEYQPLYNQLNGWGAAHLQNSIWLANLRGPSQTVRDILRQHMHPNDTICVLPLAASPDWATISARQTGIDWRKGHIA